MFTRREVGTEGRAPGGASWAAASQGAQSVEEEHHLGKELKQKAPVSVGLYRENCIRGKIKDAQM